MTDKLPPPLLALFQPRPPIRYIPPQDEAPEQKAQKTSKIGGLAAFLPQLDEYKETVKYQPTESWLQQRDRKRYEKRLTLAEMQRDDFKGYRPEDDPKVKGDPFKTLFVGRLAYDVKESDLEREFGRFGPIERIRIVKDEHADKPKKPSRGYAFIVFEREKDLKAAYKETEAPRIRDRRCVVDVERGRTVPGWRPRRFGGGLGGRGYTKQAPAKPTFGQAPASYGGGGGGFRGGFQGRGGGGGGYRGGYRGDRGGYGGRGGIGYQGGGGFGGGGGGGRPPAGAPSGPGGGRGGYGGYDDRRNGYGGGGGGYGGSRDRGPTGSNRDPVGGGRDRYDDRDRYGGRPRDDDYASRKRYHDGDQYDDPRSKRRY